MTSTETWNWAKHWSFHLPSGLADKFITYAALHSFYTRYCLGVWFHLLVLPSLTMCQIPVWKPAFFFSKFNVPCDHNSVEEKECSFHSDGSLNQYIKWKIKPSPMLVIIWQLYHFIHHHHYGQADVPHTLYGQKYVDNWPHPYVLVEYLISDLVPHLLL